jgi:hypothetical protein
MLLTYRKKRWDDVTVLDSGAALHKIRFVSQHLKVSREQGLETLLRLLLEEKGEQAELGVSRRNGFR